MMMMSAEIDSPVDRVIPVARLFVISTEATEVERR